MPRTISVVACDPNGRILRANRLKPRRLFLTPGAALIIETFGRALPVRGATVEVFRAGPGSAAWSLEPGA